MQPLNLFFLVSFFLQTKMLIVLENQTEMAERITQFETSESISAVQEEHIPTQYFVCGFSLRKKNWIFLSSECQCKRILLFFKDRKSCKKFCPTTMDSQLSGIKLVYCHVNDWKKQIQKQFSTQSSHATGYRTKQPIMCPIGYYANGFKAKFGYQYNNNLGLADLQINCQLLSRNNSILMNENKYKPNDTRNLRIGSPGNFMASIKIIYQSKGKLLGLIAQYQPIAVIKNVNIKYDMEGLEPKTVNQETLYEDSKQNCEQNKAQYNYPIKSTYSTKAKWEVLGLAGFRVKQNNIQVPMKKQENQKNLSYFIAYFDKFQFGIDIEIKFKPSKRQIKYSLSKGRMLLISSKSKHYPTKRKFMADIVFQNSFDNKQIGKITKQGYWEGQYHSIPYIRHQTKNATCSSKLRSEESRISDNGK